MTDPKEQAGESMIWVAVYKSIDGPKLRRLYKYIHGNKAEAIGILVTLWQWGLDNAEPDGRIISADKEDVEECLATLGCKASTDKIVEGLIESGWIDETDEGLFLHDWDTWQEPFYKAKARRENDNKRKQEYRRRKASNTDEDTESRNSADDSEDSPADIPQTVPTGAETPEAPPAEKKKESKYTTDFDEFWAAYPRNVDKGNAFKKYQTRVKEGFSPEELLTAAKNYALQCKREGTEQRYIKHAATFLSDTRPFLDYLPKKVEPVSTDEEVQSGNPFRDRSGG